MRKLLPEDSLLSHLKPGKWHTLLPKALARGSRPHVPTVQEGVKNSGTLATEILEPQCPAATHVWQCFVPIGVLKTDLEKVMALTRPSSIVQGKLKQQLPQV